RHRGRRGLRPRQRHVDRRPAARRRALLPHGDAAAGRDDPDRRRRRALPGPLARQHGAPHPLAMGAPHLLTPRAQHAPVLLRSGKVLVVGGADLSGPSEAPELYDPAANAWSATAGELLSRKAPTATLLQDGTVLVSGGYGRGGPVAIGDVY